MRHYNTKTMKSLPKPFICVAFFATILLSTGWAGWRAIQSGQSRSNYLLTNNLRLEPLDTILYEEKSERDVTLQDIAHTSSNLPEGNTIKFFDITRQSNPKQHRVEVNVASNTQLPDVRKCSHFLKTIKATPGPSPLTALASFPRSGNTYTGLLIQIATQYETNSVYWKSERFKPIRKAFRGVTQGFFKGRGICTKTHKHDQRHMSFFTGGAILIVRDPHKSIISQFVRQFRKSGGAKRALELIQLNDTKWIELSTRLAAEWRDTYMDWLHKAPRILIISYERLCENTFEELKHIVTFLHLPVKLEQLWCAVSLNPCQCKDWTDYQPSYPVELARYINEVNDTLITNFSTSLPSYGIKCPVREMMLPGVN